jgi:NADP-dependent 3-hydroxy acid dehydrogenase YdfG
MMKNFENKVAAITGAGSGIGQQLAIQLAKQGAHLALSDVNEQGLAETLKLVKDYPVSVTLTKLDVSDRKAVEDWAKQCEQDFGQINLIFNNAGVALASTVEGLSYEDAEWIFKINFWGMDIEPQVGWWTGWVEYPDCEKVYFSLNMHMKTGIPASVREQLVKQSLTTLGLI